MELAKREDIRARPGVNVYKGRGIGKFTVLCNGRAILPAGWWNSLCSWVLILVPSGFQVILINSAFESVLAQILIQFTYIATMVASLVALTLTTCSDPGIVPRPLSYLDEQSLLPSAPNQVRPTPDGASPLNVSLQERETPQLDADLESRAHLGANPRNAPQNDSSGEELAPAGA